MSVTHVGVGAAPLLHQRLLDGLWVGPHQHTDLLRHVDALPENGQKRKLKV